MKTCKSGSEGVSVKPDVEIHQGARLLPYKGTVDWFRVCPLTLTQTRHPSAQRQNLSIRVAIQNVGTP